MSSQPALPALWGDLETALPASCFPSPHLHRGIPDLCSSNPFLAATSQKARYKTGSTESDKRKQKGGSCLTEAL